jgi:glycosyltransferase involved in cell wall biosynthesis
MSEGSTSLRKESILGDGVKAGVATGVELAVVIPAWRGRHLGAALESLRSQTDRRFRVYIGDDASGDDLLSLAKENGRGLDLVYHRFEENLGGRDLVAHWHRCIALTEKEPWIWLFSDDDVAEPECVATFFGAIQSGLSEVDLMRFNLKIIDDNGALVRTPKPNLPWESASEFLHSILVGGGREWRAPEHIFSRRVYQRKEGFVSLPMALYTDLATWVEFAEKGGVKTLPGPHLCWRSHGGGISSGQRIQNNEALIEALTGFLHWLEHHLERDSGEDFQGICLTFLCRELRRMQPPVRWRLFGRFVDRARALAPRHNLVMWRIIIALGLSRARHLPGVSRLAYWRYRRRMA